MPPLSIQRLAQASDATRELNIFRHDRDAFGMDSTQVAAIRPAISARD